MGNWGPERIGQRETIRRAQTIRHRGIGRPFVFCESGRRLKISRTAASFTACYARPLTRIKPCASSPNRSASSSKTGNTLNTLRLPKVSLSRRSAATTTDHTCPANSSSSRPTPPIRLLWDHGRSPPQAATSAGFSRGRFAAPISPPVQFGRVRAVRRVPLFVANKG